MQKNSPEFLQTSGVIAEEKTNKQRNITLKNDYDNSVAQNLESYENVGGEISERKWNLNVRVKPEHLVPGRHAVVITSSKTNLQRLLCIQMSRTSKIRR